MALQISNVPNEDSALRAWRQSQGLTLVEAGRRVGSTHSVWQRWETGGRLPSSGSLKRLCAATGLSADQILGLQPYHLPESDDAGMSADSAASDLDR